jgi:hypothetical protein
MENPIPKRNFNSSLLCTLWRLEQFSVWEVVESRSERFLLIVGRSLLASRWRITVFDDDEFSQLEQAGPVWTRFWVSFLQIENLEFVF